MVKTKLTLSSSNNIGHRGSSFVNRYNMVSPSYIESSSSMSTWMNAPGTTRGETSDCLSWQ
jgi:hypothetical protein